MIRITQVTVTEPQAAFIADAILISLCALKRNDELLRESVANLMQSLMDGDYTVETLNECNELVEKLADTFRKKI